MAKNIPTRFKFNFYGISRHNYRQLIFDIKMFKLLICAQGKFYFALKKNNLYYKISLDYY